MDHQAGWRRNAAFRQAGPHLRAESDEGRRDENRRWREMLSHSVRRAAAARCNERRNRHCSSLAALPSLASFFFAVSHRSIITTSHISSPGIPASLSACHQPLVYSRGHCIIVTSRCLTDHGYAFRELGAIVRTAVRVSRSRIHSPVSTCDRKQGHRASKRLTMSDRNG